MRFIHSLIVSVLAAALAAVVATSCSGADEPLIPEGEGSAMGAEASFILEVNGENSGSRAPSVPAGGYDPGAGYENYIDIPGRDFRFYFFDANDKFIDTLEITMLQPVGTSAHAKRYRVDGRLPAALATQPFKVVALANWGRDNYPDSPSTIDDLFDTQYTFAPSRMALSETNTVPLYGVTNLLTDIRFNSENWTDLGKIHLLRAFAKVEVRVAEQCAATLKSVTMTRYNTGGYNAPAGVTLQDQYVHNNYDTDYTGAAYVPEGVGVGTDLAMMPMAGGGFIAYVPEYRNVGVGSANRTRFILRFVGEDDSKSYSLEFARFDDPAQPPMDILRNVWYRFIVNKIDDNIDIKIHCKVQVVPYSQVVLNPEFGLLIGSKLVAIRDADGNILYYYDRETGLYYYDPNGLSPVGKEPYPGLMKDPVKGWNIVRDDFGRFKYYYDPATGKYYNIDREEIPDPTR